MRKQSHSREDTTKGQLKPLEVAGAMSEQEEESSRLTGSKWQGRNQGRV